jgi:predicted DNA-binding transcriptional regulator AlpA
MAGIHQDNIMRAKGYMTIADVEKLTKANRSTIYRWARRGLLQTQALGRAVYFDAASVRDLLSAVPQEG